MAYWDLSQLAEDADFRQRTAACASTQAHIVVAEHPLGWADANAWGMAATPGFADAYAYAVETGVEYPGRDPSVITDPQILSAVQTLAPPREGELWGGGFVGR